MPSHGVEEYQFLPVVEEGAACLEDWQWKEREFFNSLSFLAQLYGFTPAAREDHPYPLNILRALEAASGCIKQRSPEVNSFIFRDDTHLATIGTYTSLSTGTTLYYIPLAPLDKLLQNEKRRKEAGLLCSLFSYLHKILQIDAYTEEQSYLYYYYDMLREGEVYIGENEVAAVMEQVNTAFDRGKKMEALILQKCHLTQFKNRVSAFKPKDKGSKALLDAAKQAVQLYAQYPKRAIGPSIPSGIIEPYEEDYPENPPIQCHQYLSFVWETKGPMADVLFEWVNADIQEAMGCDEPVNIQVFDKPQKSITLNLDFEKKVFQLLSDITYYLNNTI